VDSLGHLAQPGRTTPELLNVEHSHSNDAGLDSSRAVAEKALDKRHFWYDSRTETPPGRLKNSDKRKALDEV
jgi:hypothetical protein